MRKEQRWMLALTIVVAFAAVGVLAAGPVGAGDKKCAALRLAADKVGCPPALVEKTGQETPQAEGDDGDLQMGVAWPAPRFTDNEDGTVTDNLTGLIWLKDASCLGADTWANAFDRVDDLNNRNDYSCNSYTAGTFSDWRLPNVKELQSLIDYGTWNPALPSGHLFTDVQSGSYWSSTTYAGTPDFAWAWTVSLGHGIVFPGPKVDTSPYVCPVRGGH